MIDCIKIKFNFIQCIMIFVGIVILSLVIPTTKFQVFAKAIDTYYVSMDGSDTNTGTINDPFRTIQKGLDILKPGETLMIREGIYNETTNVFDKKGAPDAWYNIKSYPGESVTMTGEYKLNWGEKIAPDAITFRNSSYWNIEGIKMTQYTGAGIYVADNSEYINMSNLTIWDLDFPTYRPYGTSGIDGESSSYCSVKNCHIYNVGLKVDKPKDHGIYIGYGSYNWVFENNNIHDNAGAAIQLYGSPNGGSNCIITNNRLYNNHAYGVAIGSNATNNCVTNNIFYGNNWSDVYMLESSTKNWFKNNLFVTGYNNYNVQLTDNSSVDNSFDFNTYYKTNGIVANRYDQILNYDQWKSYSQEESGKYINDYKKVEEEIGKWEPQSLKNYSSVRLSGLDRFNTAVKVAEKFNHEKINNVVITSGYNFTNALSGSVLAKKINSPILLSGKTDEDNLATIEYIKKYLNKDGLIYVLGNEFNENEKIIISLKELGYTNIKILEDGEKFGAVKSINDEINASTGTPVIVASGNGFADGLSISSIAAANGYPIIFSDFENIPNESLETLKKISPSHVYIIGGNGVISDTVKEEIKKITNLPNENVIRIFGEDRYETAINIAKYFKMDGENVILSSGSDFPDAISSSVLAAKIKAPLILLGDNNHEQKIYIDSKKFINQIVIGGEASVSYNTQKKLAQ